MVAHVAREEGGQTDAKLSTGFSGCAGVGQGRRNRGAADSPSRWPLPKSL